MANINIPNLKEITSKAYRLKSNRTGRSQNSNLSSPNLLLWNKKHMSLIRQTNLNSILNFIPPSIKNLWRRLGSHAHNLEWTSWPFKLLSTLLLLQRLLGQPQLTPHGSISSANPVIYHYDKQSLGTPVSTTNRWTNVRACPPTCTGRRSIQLWKASKICFKSFMNNVQLYSCCYTRQMDSTPGGHIHIITQIPIFIRVWVI